MPGSMMSISTTSGVGAVEQLDRLLAAAGLVDRPALVLERELDRRADAFVVFDGQDAGTHGRHDARNPAATPVSGAVARSAAAARAIRARELVEQRRVGDEHLLGARRAAREVAGAAPGLAGDQLAGGEVPRAEVLLEVHVDAPGGDVAEVDRRRTEAADVADRRRSAARPAAACALRRSGW